MGDNLVGIFHHPFWPRIQYSHIHQFNLILSLIVLNNEVHIFNLRIRNSLSLNHGEVDFLNWFEVPYTTFGVGRSFFKLVGYVLDCIGFEAFDDFKGRFFVQIVWNGF